MNTLQISKANALAAYEGATPKQRKMLSNLFGKAVFQKSAIERIKTYEDACADLDLEPLALSSFMFLPGKDQKHAFASHQLTVLNRALNEGWEPNWSNGQELKYYGYFKYAGSGSGFSFLGYYCGGTLSGVGSRLVFKSRELAEYAGKQFISIYNDYLSL
jgi:hypothetical protein